MKLTWTALKLETQWTSAIGLKLNRCIIYIYITAMRSKYQSHHKGKLELDEGGKKGMKGAKQTKPGSKNELKDPYTII